MQEQNKKTLRGRGIAENIPNRFESLSFEADPSLAEEEQPSPATRFYRDPTRRLISYNDSPDIRFDAAINPYRGCEHGCVYCYARPTHEYLGFSAGLDFETRILVKEDAPNLLRKELSAQKWKPQLLALSGVTDCYQPAERRFQLTRKCLEVLLDFRNPVLIITKNQLVTRDIDLLSQLVRYQCVCVFISLSSLDHELIRVMEPRTSRPSSRLQAIRCLSAAGIPVGVMTAPVVPGLNDHEIPKVIEAAADAGAKYTGFTLLRLPYAVKELFTQFLHTQYPTHADKVIHRIQEMRGGKLNASEFGKRFRGEGIYAQQIHQLFQNTVNKAGLNQTHPPLSTEHFRIPSTQPVQTLLW